MARRFGGNSNLNFGSDASIDQLDPKSAFMHFQSDSAVAEVYSGTLLDKSDPVVLTHAGWTFQYRRSLTSTGHLHFKQELATTDNEWTTPDDAITTNQATVGFNYDFVDNNSDPDIYVDAVLQAEGAQAGLGAIQSDAAIDLRMGEDSAAGVDLTASKVGWLVFDDTVFTAAEINRHRWWGGLEQLATRKIVMPMWTDNLVNKGNATANPTDNASTMDSFPKVERMYASMMGVGR